MLGNDALTMNGKPNLKKGIKVIPPWQVGDTDNFHGIDTGRDTDIEPAQADDWDSDDNKDRK